MRSLGTLGLLLSCALAAGGCLPDWKTYPPDLHGDAGADAMDGADALSDAVVMDAPDGTDAVDAAGDVFQCDSGTACGASCVDTQTDRSNCGACGHRCGGFCSAGSCVDPVQLSSGASHVCARMSDGTVRCWGRNHKGQIGNSTMADALRPVPVMGLSGVVDVAARSNADDLAARSCAVLNSGAIQCWGDNATGEFGDGTTTNQNHPATSAQGLSSASKVGLGGSHSCALAGPFVYCWGANNNGSLGYSTSAMCGSVPCSTTPQLVTGLSSSGLVAQQVVASEVHTCVLLSDHTVRCFGNAFAGTLGNGVVGTGGPTPVVVMGLNTAAQLATAYTSTCAVTMSGQAYCWGSNSVGQLGDGTTMQRSTPVPLALSPSETIAQLGMGMFHGCAVTTSGAVYCWGKNDQGQLGSDPGGCDASSCGSLTPVQVPGVDNAEQVVGGMAHTCVLRRDHSVLCWGANDHGQLGDDTNASRATPAPVLF